MDRQRSRLKNTEHGLRDITREGDKGRDGGNERERERERERETKQMGNESVNYIAMKGYAKRQRTF